MKGRVYVKTYGCQMNVRDTSAILGVLKQEGYEMTDNIDEADVIIINTCAVREKAEQKVLSELGRLKMFKQRCANVVVGIGGCMAQEAGRTIAERFPHVDVVFGTHSLHRLPELIEKASSGEKAVDVSTDYTPGERFSAKRLRVSSGLKEYVTVMEGCDNFCAYCIVPHVRGREVSRPPEDILEEVKELVSRGTKEITLVGQNVNSYGLKEGWGVDFPHLLDMVAATPGLQRLRFITSHPRDFTEQLARRFVTLDVLCEHLHLPVQAGSTRILKAMNRGYTRDEYLRKVEMVKKLPVTVALSTDIIVGFPGETEKDFQDTLSLLEEVQFDFIFSFAYSPRPGTPAARLHNQVPLKVRLERLAQVQALQKEITLKKNRDLENRVVDVLVEGTSRRDRHELTGRTRCNRVVNFPGPSEVMGREVKVHITQAHANSLRGEIVETAQEGRNHD